LTSSLFYQRSARSSKTIKIEGFLDVGHFAFVHIETFGDRTNPEVPTYAVTPTANGFQATIQSISSSLIHLG
jgi:vanillate O-demethylase monooxygenase subunit